MSLRYLQERYINPYTDFGFKRLFGMEANKDILINFLNQLINEHGKITDIQYLNRERVGRSKFDRKAIYDIYCKTKSGEHFIVELQRAEQKYFKDRSVFYTSFPIQDQAKRGVWNFKLNAVYFVGILDFVFDEDKSSKDFFHHEVKLVDITTHKVFYDKLTYIYLEMPKFKKRESELETLFDKWLYVLKSLPNLRSRPAKLQERVFQRLFKIAEIANFSKAEADLYEDSLKVYRDLKNVMDTAVEKAREKALAEGIEKGIEQGISRGKAEGLAEGVAQGRAEGLAEGVAQGRAEGLAEGVAQGKAEGLAEGKHKEALATARKMKAKGYATKDISEITGLSEGEIGR